MCPCTHGQVLETKNESDKKSLECSDYFIMRSLKISTEQAIPENYANISCKLLFTAIVFFTIYFKVPNKTINSFEGRCL